MTPAQQLQSAAAMRTIPSLALAGALVVGTSCTSTPSTEDALAALQSNPEPGASDSSATLAMLESMVKHVPLSPELVARLEELRMRQATQTPLAVRIDAASVGSAFHRLPRMDSYLAVQSAGPTSCLGVNEDGDAFGRAIAAGDFDGDGIMDLAVGAPNESHFDVDWVGSVYVFKGTPHDGLQPWFVLNQAQERKFDQLGFALTSGDFNNDGFSDLAVGVPFKDLNGAQDVGYVLLFRGGPTGLTTWGGLTETGAVSAAHDYFGRALASGDFDGDGTDDLVVGAPYKNQAGHTEVGSIFIYPGGPNGTGLGYPISHDALRPSHDQEYLGTSFAVGDWNQDGRADLATGATPDDGGRGSVYVFTMNTASHRLVPVQRLTQTPNMYPGFAFGESFASGDFDGDGHDDLAVGVSATNIGTTSDAGKVEVFRSSPAGLSNWSVLIPPSVVPNTQGYSFGQHLAAGDFDGDGDADLMVLSGLQILSDEGTVDFFRGGSAGLASWGRRFIPDGDFVSSANAVADLDGDGRKDIIINSKNQHESSGAVRFLHGESGSIPTVGPNLTQETPGCVHPVVSPPAIALVEAKEDRLTVRITAPVDTLEMLWDFESLVGTVGGRELVKTFSGLQANKSYCVHAKRVGSSNEAWSDTAEACFKTTLPPPPTPMPHSGQVWLARQQIFEGPIPYLGYWGPISGATLQSISVVGNFNNFALGFVKPGYNTGDCGTDPQNAVVMLRPGQTATPEQMQQIFGTATPVGSATLLACHFPDAPTGIVSDYFVVNVTYLQ